MWVVIKDVISVELEGWMLWLKCVKLIVSWVWLDFFVSVMCEYEMIFRMYIWVKRLLRNWNLVICRMCICVFKVWVFFISWMSLEGCDYFWWLNLNFCFLFLVMINKVIWKCFGFDFYIYYCIILYNLLFYLWNFG